MSKLVNLKSLRIQKGLTMKELGVILGVTESSISFYESGKREPSIGTLVKMAEYFLVSLDELILGLACQGQNELIEIATSAPSNEQVEIWELFKLLDYEDKIEIRGEIKGMLKAQKYSVMAQDKRA